MRHPAQRDSMQHFFATAVQNDANGNTYSTIHMLLALHLTSVRLMASRRVMSRSPGMPEERGDTNLSTWGGHVPKGCKLCIKSRATVKNCKLSWTASQHGRVFFVTGKSCATTDAP